jgi:hypothetical protein
MIRSDSTKVNYLNRKTMIDKKKPKAKPTMYLGYMLHFKKKNTGIRYRSMNLRTGEGGLHGYMLMSTLILHLCIYLQSLWL